jgi:hypothetical protein
MRFAISSAATAPWLVGRIRAHDRRVHAVKLEPGFLQPARQLLDGVAVVIVEMTPRREQLDRFEPVPGDLSQMVAMQRPVVKEMRGNPETHGTS